MFGYVSSRVALCGRVVQMSSKEPSGMSGEGGRKVGILRVVGRIGDRDEQRGKGSSESRQR